MAGPSPQPPTLEAPLPWTHTVQDVGARGLDIKRSASAAELNALEAALGVLNVASFDAAYEVRIQSGRRYRIEGTFKANVTQACVVTLDPVVEHIDESFAVGFNPPERLEHLSDAERSVLDEPDVEVLDGDSLEIGRVLYDLLASALDPYPRAAGAEFTFRDRLDSGSDHPFAALAKLKKQ